MQLKVTELLNKLGLNSGIYVETFANHSEKYLAYSKGAPVFGGYFGGIFVFENIQKTYQLSDQEIEFILAHELSHIIKGHYPVSIILELPKIILDSIKEDWSKILGSTIDLIKLLIYLKGDMPQKEAVMRDHEFEADEYAIFLMHIKGYNTAKNIAISCLTKLSGYNTSIPSHVAKIAKTNIPLLTINNRIARIRNIDFGNICR